MGVRKAVSSDVSRMVALSAKKRQQYEKYSPLFWRESADALANQTRFFEGLLTNPSWICLVHETFQWVDGFIMAHLVIPPPVYDPGGKVCLIDDFVMDEPELWNTAGVELREETHRRAMKLGASVSVTVCGQKDIAKRVFLATEGAHVASEWYVQPLDMK
jgi:hypothetical protein